MQNGYRAPVLYAKGSATLTVKVNPAFKEREREREREKSNLAQGKSTRSRKPKLSTREKERERKSFGTEQEHSLSKAKVKHDRAWSPNGRVTVTCSALPARRFVRSQILCRLCKSPSDVPIN